MRCSLNYSELCAKLCTRIIAQFRYPCSIPYHTTYVGTVIVKFTSAFFSIHRSMWTVSHIWTVVNDATVLANCALRMTMTHSRQYVDFRYVVAGRR